jgi:hypothetical protein
MMTLAALALAALPCPAPACSLCFNIKQTGTLRQEALSPTARLVLFGTLSNARLTSDRGAGTTDFTISAVLRADPTLSEPQRKQKGDVVVLPHYLPPERPGAVVHCLAFCDVIGGRCDPYRPLIVSPVAATYLRDALVLPANDVRARLLYFFRYLDHADEMLSRDAFMEFVKASDREVGEIAPGLPAAKLRAWLRDPKTAEYRLGLYAFLLGGHGSAADRAWFEDQLAHPTERTAGAFDGILGGYIRLRSREGWELASRILRDGKYSLPVRLAVVRTLRFYHAWKPVETQAQLLAALAAILAQGELADLAVEELRQWRVWDLTEKVLALYGRPGLDAPLQRRAIVRYALCCPLPRARDFVESLRKQERELVDEIEEAIRFER